MSAKRVRTRVGDVFQIPVDGARSGHGQIVAEVRDKPPFIAVFEPLFPRDRTPRPEEIVRSKIAFLAESFTSMIVHGYWTIIANVPPDLSRIPFPFLRIAYDSLDNHWIVSYDGTQRRPATPADLRWFDPPASVAPIRLEKALKALHGLGDWDPVFDRLRYEHVEERSRPPIGRYR